MGQQHRTEPPATFSLIVLGAVVLAFMGLSLAVTTVGTARFAVALGYPQEVGYAVGAILDLGKAILPVGLLMLMTRRAVLFFAVLGIAWLGLMTFTWLATSATLGSAIAAIERNGNWKMSTRASAETELAGIERRLAALSEPSPLAVSGLSCQIGVSASSTRAVDTSPTGTSPNTGKILLHRTRPLHQVLGIRELLALDVEVRVEGLPEGDGPGLLLMPLATQIDAIAGCAPDRVRLFARFSQADGRVAAEPELAPLAVDRDPKLPALRLGLSHDQSQSATVL